MLCEWNFMKLYEWSNHQTFVTVRSIFSSLTSRALCSFPRPKKAGNCWQMCPTEFQSDALLAAGSGSCAINPEKSVRCFSWNRPIAAFTHLHQIERSPALSRSSASVLPGAGGNLSCETVDGTVGEERNAEGKCFPVDNGQSNCLAHSRRAEGYTSKFKKKGKSRLTQPWEII